MALVTERAKRIDVPGEDAWIEIKALGWLVLENARTKRLHQLAELMKSLKDLTLPTSGNQQQADPITGYDKLYLLKHGIAAWSYGETVDVEQLDDPTAEWAAREILAYSVPGEPEMGKHSSPSTATSAEADPLRKNGR